jgi:hypothetical protein
MLAQASGFGNEAQLPTCQVPRKEAHGTNLQTGPMQLESLPKWAQSTVKKEPVSRPGKTFKAEMRGTWLHTQSGNQYAAIPVRLCPRIRA